MSYTEQELSLLASLQQGLVKINSTLKQLKPMGFISRQLSEIKLKHGPETLTVKPTGVEVVQKLDLGAAPKSIGEPTPQSQKPITKQKQKPTKKPEMEIKPLEENLAIDKLKGINQDRFASVLDKAAMAVINK